MRLDGFPIQLFIRIDLPPLSCTAVFLRSELRSDPEKMILPLYFT
jgi:hypothetical protein